MKHKYLRLLILAAVCLNLFGCSGETYEEETEAAAEEVILPVTFRADPTTNQSDNLSFVQDFNEAFAGEYYMDAEWLTETSGGYRNKIKQWNVLDEMPVLITDAGFDYDFYQILIENDRLVNLRPYMEASEFWMDVMNPDVLADCTEEDGGIYLAPLGSNVHTYAGIIYNEELLASVGYDTFPTTWDEFWECLDALQSAGITPLALHGSGSYWVPMLFATAYLYSSPEGQEFLNEGFPESFQRLSVKDMMNMLKKLFTYTFSDALELDYDQTAQRFLNDEAAIIANGKWMFDSIPEEEKEVLRFTCFPEQILMNSPRMSAWAATTGYSEEVTEGAVKALEFRIQCEQEEAKTVINNTADPLQASYGETITQEHTIMPNYQLQWEQEIQNEFFTAYMPGFLNGSTTLSDFLIMLDERIHQIESKK